MTNVKTEFWDMTIEVFATAPNPDRPDSLWIKLKKLVGLTWRQLDIYVISGAELPDIKKRKRCKQEMSIL